MKRIFSLSIAAAVLASPILMETADAQTARAQERRENRNERQLQRQVNRADYYSDQAWSRMSPWVQGSGVVAGNIADRTAARAAQSADLAVDGELDRNRPVAGNAARTAAGAAAGAAANVAANAVRGNYGYNSQPGDQFFYDYYSVAPTYYVPNDTGDAYRAAVRYYDGNNDGVYDSYATHRDSDNDGVYDEYDRYDFVTGSQAEDNYQGPNSAARQTVSGSVEMAKTSMVGSSKNLVVAVASGNNQPQVVDLGPADQLRGVSVGTQITATGHMEEVGDKQLLVADTVQIGGQQQVEIQRSSGPAVQGTIVDVQTFDVQSQPHYFAIVESGEGRQLVDLGPQNTYKQAPAAQTQVTVYGVPIQTRDQRVLLADRVEIAGQTLRIPRGVSF